MTLRQAVVLVGAKAVWQMFLRRVVPRPRAPKLPDMASEIEALKREHAGDPVAMQEALGELFRAHRMRPYAACLSAFVPVLFALVIKAPALRSALNQDPFEALARTVVVLE